MKAGVRNLLIIATPFVAIALSFAAFALYLREWRRPDVERFGSVGIGDTEDDVRARLGPTFREFTREAAPREYYVSGFGSKRREVTGKVLIYMGRKSDLIFYVWIDANGRVEDLFLGGS